MNAVELEIYRNLFASIAEEMGAVLMRSAFSPNIKERRDFSCAIFDRDGEMVAQAAHIPVHLGSTPLSVAAAMKSLALRSGEAAVLNDPFSGGTHLPDITMILALGTAGEKPLFYLANRAHHADVGGKTPGSMSLSKKLSDEGFIISPRRYTPQVEEEIALASRTPDERRGDLKAQVAANFRGGKRLLDEFIRRGWKLLEAARALQEHSERFMAATIKTIPDGRYEFEDFLDDDGYDTEDIPLRVEVIISGEQATVDFSKSADQVEGPVNVPYAVTLSATLYAFRCLASRELPTNGGYMRCIEVRTRKGSILDAKEGSAVALGNVETSQRVTDLVFGALSKALPQRIPAASCGSMNNLSIGGHDPRQAGLPFAYYETIAGGSGAGPGFHGQNGVHTHMTNTLNTPVEALEHAYPFRVERYALRDASGGEGEYRGGDGVIREYSFQAPAMVSLMTERRRRPPYGLAGGNPGQVGENILVTKEGGRRLLPPKARLQVQPGDTLIVATPGGGGFGAEKKE